MENKRTPDRFLGHLHPRAIPDAMGQHQIRAGRLFVAGNGDRRPARVYRELCDRHVHWAGELFIGPADLPEALEAHGGALAGVCARRGGKSEERLLGLLVGIGAVVFAGAEMGIGRKCPGRSDAEGVGPIKDASRLAGRVGATAQANFQLVRAGGQRLRAELDPVHIAKEAQFHQIRAKLSGGERLPLATIHAPLKWGTDSLEPDAVPEVEVAGRGDIKRIRQHDSLRRNLLGHLAGID